MNDLRNAPAMEILPNLQACQAIHRTDTAGHGNSYYRGSRFHTGLKKGLVLQGGFTLLELLISITLISIIVVILSLALRTGISAYTRAKGGNEQLVAAVAIEELLTMQLRAIVDTKQPGLKDLSLFEGSGNGLLMTTTHVPMGSGLGGVFLVTYRFNPDSGELIYAQRIVTTKDDLKARLPDDITEEGKAGLLEEGWDISIIPGLKDVSFSYQGHAGDTDPSAWPRQWERRSAPPSTVALTLVFKDVDSGRSMTSRRIFHVSVS